MRILFLSQFPLFGNGSGNYTRKLASQLIKHKHQVACASPDNHPLDKIIKYEIKPYIKAVFVSNPEWKNAKKFSELTTNEISKNYISYFNQIIKIVEEFKPDVIHVNHCFMLTWIANYIRAIYGIGFVVTTHGTCIMQNSIDKRYFSLTQRSLQGASSIIAVSNHTKKWFFKVFGRKFTHKTKVITGGIDLSNYKKEIVTKNIEKKYKLEGKKVIIFAGRLTKIKGVEYLIGAAPQINGEIFIIGSGDEKANLEKLAQSKKISNIHFIGYLGAKDIGELREFYQRASALVVPSIWDEPLGLVILEAMVCGTPVVATKKGGIPLALKDNYNSILVRARSTKAIYEAVNKIIENEKFAAKLGENAKKTVEEKFDWKNLSKKIELLYQKAYQYTQKSRKIQKIDYLKDKDILREKQELKNIIGFGSQL